MKGKSILKKVKIIMVFTFFSFLLVLSQPVLADYKEPGDLFADTKLAGTMDTDSDSTVIRSRVVKVDFKRFFWETQPGQDQSCPASLLHLNLFPGTFFIARLDHVVKNPSGSISWIGGTQEEESNSVILTVRDNIMFGSISTWGESYQIRYLGNGIHEIRQTDHGKYPEYLEPIPVYNEETAGDILVGDTGAWIEIMVVYTGAARAAVGGTAAMETLIDNAVAETNVGYTNSGVNPRIILVHTAEVVYSEAGFDWVATIERLRLPGDGYMDNVHSLRDTYKADLVVMLVNDNAYCGVGYLMASVSPSFESWAFSLVHWACATGYYSFAHEMGHNQAARHDRYVDNTDFSPDTCNHGYVYLPDQWLTIMSYNDQCYDNGFYCTRLNYWSNPNVLYGGVPMGVPCGVGEGAYNVYTLNDTAYTVANFRVSNLPPVFNNIYGTVGSKEGTTISLDMSATDPNPLDTVTYGIVGTPPGASFDNTTGAFTWTPDYTQAGTYSVAFSASDGELVTIQIVVIEVINVKKITK